MPPTRHQNSPASLAGARLGSWRKASGISLVGALLIILLAYGLYYLVGKPSHKADDSAPASEAAPPRVVIYTQSSCEPCNGARTWLKQHHVAFEERDVDAFSSYQDDLKKLGSRIVPVILVNDEPLYGFQVAYLQEALNNARARRHN